MSRKICPQCGFRLKTGKPLTRRQFEILGAVRLLLRRGFSPSYQEIAEKTGIGSLATVHKHLSNLERKGYLKRQYNRSRSLELA